jgi:histone-lysine N-methyltransferase SUV39H
MSTTSPFTIPVEGAMEVQNTCAHEDDPFLDDVIDDMPPSEGLQGVTESIGSLDLHEHSRSPEVDIDVDQVGVSPLESIGENECLDGIPVSAELMEHELESLEMLVDVVSAENVEQAPVSVDERCDVDEEDPGVDMRKTRALARRTKARSMSTGASGDSDQECLAVLMQLDASDGELQAGDADHPISIDSSRTVSSHTSSRQLSRSPVSTGPLGVVGDASSVKQLEDGVEYYMGGYPVVTWNSYSQAQRLMPPKYRLAKDLPHELQDRVNALPQSYRDSPQATVLFEAMIDEAMDDEPGAPPISVINEVTDEGAPPWEFVYTNQMWYGEGVPPPDIKNLKSCGCVGRCDPKSKTCGCAKRQRHHLKRYIANNTIPNTWNGVPFLYDSKGSLQFFGMPIFECNDFCGCDEDCPNRVVQRGRRYAINIKRTEFKGWGIFNGPKKIPGGSFIGIYAGELLTVEESDRRGALYNKFGRTYLFDIDFHFMGAVATYSVDAYHAGNFTRFLNHSCDPNCEINPCYINEANIDKPLLTVFTKRDVEPSEELSFSYMGCIDDDMIFKAKNAKKSNDAVYAECHCGSANCLGVLFS